jgi:hypothetical protein
MRQMVVRLHPKRPARSLTRVPAAMARMIRACGTWNHAKRRSWATNSKMGRSAAEMVSGRGLRPRMRMPPTGATLNITDDPNLLHDL